jgi:hypothetical protein
LHPEKKVNILATPTLSGPFPLTKIGIDSTVTKTSPGVYALGKTVGNTFYISRVGRSDANLNKRLHDYEGQYAQFKALYYDSPRAAFQAECQLWHAYGGNNNPLHPDRPQGTNWTCPESDNCL